MLDLVEVSAENLAILAVGRPGLAINAALNACLSDLEDRGSDEKPRKVVITIEMTKVDPEAQDARIEISVKSSVPAYATGVTIARLKRKSASRVVATFQPDCPANPDQGTLFSNRPRHPEAPETDAHGEVIE